MTRSTGDTLLPNLPFGGIMIATNAPKPCIFQEKDRRLSLHAVCIRQKVA
jgi:hypothetical protein